MKASTETLRKQNRSLVLSTLRRLGPASHTDISDWSGLSSATVSTITGELETEGVLERLEHQGEKGRGRPRVLFRQNPDSAYVAAVRITADRIEYSLVDYCGTLKDRFETQRASQHLDVESFKSLFRDGLVQLAERSRLHPSRVLTTSITSKGLAAEGNPVLLWSPVFDDTQIDFSQMLKPDWTGRVTLTNETRFAAQAIAARLRGGPSSWVTRHFATLSLDHSIGLGISTIDATGAVTSFAPPFGHMVHQAEGPLCRCGSKGCIEAYAGFYGILRTAFEVPPDTIPAKFIPLAEMDSIAARARGGDRMSEYAFRVAGEVLGMGISRLYSFLGAMPLTITGPGLRYFDLMKAGMENHIHNNLPARFGQVPEIAFEAEEAILIFEGNVEASLADLDRNVIAERKLMGVQT